MERAKVGPEYQIPVPPDALKRLRIESGDVLLVDVRENSIVLMPAPRNYSKHLQALHAEIWGDIHPVEYVRTERDAWTR